MLKERGLSDKKKEVHRSPNLRPDWLNAQILACQNLGNSNSLVTTWFSAQILHLFYQNVGNLFCLDFDNEPISPLVPGNRASRA